MDCANLKCRELTLGVVALSLLGDVSLFYIKSVLIGRYGREVRRMRSSHLLFKLNRLVLLPLPIYADLHHAPWVFSVVAISTSFAIYSGRIKYFGILRNLNRTFIRRGLSERFLVANVILVKFNVLISNQLFRFCNGTINALMESTSQFHTVDQLILFLDRDTLFLGLLPRNIRPIVVSEFARSESRALRLQHMLPMLLLELGLLGGYAFQTIDSLALVVPVERKPAAKACSGYTLRFYHILLFSRAWFGGLGIDRALTTRLIENVMSLATLSTGFSQIWGTVLKSINCNGSLPGGVSAYSDAAGVRFKHPFFANCF